MTLTDARPDAPPPVTSPARLEELGRMTASVAHDFNNILAVIMVCASEVAAAAESRGQRERAEEIREAAQRGAELSRRLLAGEAVYASPAEPLDVDEAVAAALPLVRRTLGDGIEISLVGGGALPRVRLAGGELERILVNLAANSRDAMRGSGKVVIHTSEIAVPSGDPYLGAGLHVRVGFSDEGCGMTPDVARHATQPRFTTKGGDGSGLGLATVQSLLRASHGDLRINTMPGAGTTISLYLPAVDQSGEPLALEPARTDLNA